MMKLTAASRLLFACTLVASAAIIAAEVADEVPFKEGDGPPPAKPGEGWCLVMRPATYKSITERVESRPATFYMEVVPAKFETKEEQILVQPEVKRAVVVPAKYKTEKYQQKVREECVRYEIIPAQYQTVEEDVVIKADGEITTVTEPSWKTVTEQIEVAPKRTYWKKVDEGKGKGGQDCFCLCEVPAQYVTVTKKVLDKDGAVAKVPEKGLTKKVKVQKLVKEAEVKKIVEPAEFVTMERQVIETPAAVNYETIPAKYETIRKQVQVEPESKRRVEVPAKFETVTKQVLDQPAHMVWRRIKCDCHEVVKKYKEIPGTDIESLMKLR